MRPSRRRWAFTCACFLGTVPGAMRIIGGDHRHRRILAPNGTRITRPITDRVKQSLFDRLAARGDLDGEAALDLFSGTGSLGLEALSRGVAHCTFVERDRAARRLLEQNLAALALTDRAAVLGMDALAGAWLEALPHRPVTLVFCDPPYDLTTPPPRLSEMLELVRTIGPAMADEAPLMLRTAGGVRPGPVESFAGPESFPYGSMATHLYTRVIARPGGNS